MDTIIAELLLLGVERVRTEKTHEAALALAKTVEYLCEHFAIAPVVITVDAPSGDCTVTIQAGETGERQETIRQLRILSDLLDEHISSILHRLVRAEYDKHGGDEDGVHILSHLAGDFADDCTFQAEVAPDR